MLLPSYKVGLQQRDPSPYWSPELARQKSFLDFYNANDAVNNNIVETILPQFDWGAKAQALGSDTAQLNFSNALNIANNAYLNNSAPVAGLQQQGVQGSPRLRAILRALGAQESGNNYGAVNKSSGAMGRWQVMPGNIQGSGGWDMEALGRNISTQEFMQNRQLQNQIVRFKLKNYLDKYGLKGALSTWYSGDPKKAYSKTPQGGYPSVYNYIQEILHRLGM